MNIQLFEQPEQTLSNFSWDSVNGCVVCVSLAN